MDNKKQELETTVQQEHYDIATFTKTWWDHSLDQSAAMEGYKLFRRGRQGRIGIGVALYVRECFDSVELSAENEKVRFLWVKIRGKANKVGVCYRPLNQDEEADEAFNKQLAEVIQLSVLVLIGDINLPDICRK